MSLLEREKFEALLNELHGEPEHSRKTEILQELRANQSNAYGVVGDYEKKVERLERDNNDLVLSNSKLFRQLSIDNPEPKPEEKQKQFSETVTIEQ
jgi:regulator of replication initiation timing